MKINNNMPAVILAAGRGIRLGKLSDNKPKPMTEVAGIQIIDNLVESLIKNGIKRIIIATGYMHKTLEGALDKFQKDTEIIYIYNEIYGSTNNIYSLWLTKKYLQNGFYLFEADVFFETAIMQRLINSEAANVMLIGKHNEMMEGTVVDLNAENLVQQMYLKRHQKEGFDFSNKFKTVNFYKIGKKISQDFFLPKMDEHINNKDLNSYYELIIKEALEKKYKFFGLKTDELKWWEIDTKEDLLYTEELFTS